jgi:hypothetical protein
MIKSFRFIVGFISEFYNEIKRVIVSIWNDFTLLGKCTIAVPTIILCICTMIVMIPIIIIFYFIYTIWPKKLDIWIEEKIVYIKKLFVK